MEQRNSYLVLSVYPLKRATEVETMRVSYDAEHDIAYIRFSRKRPDGAIEVDERVALDTMAENEIVGIEIFDAKKRIPVRSLFRLDVAGRTH